MSDEPQGNPSGNEGNEGQNTEFLSQIPEDLRNDPSLQDIKDVTGLAKGYVHAQRMVGSDKVAIPGKDAPDSDWDTVYNKLGRPETMDGYKLPEFKDDHPAKEFVPSEEQVGKFQDVAHKLGLTQSQFAGLMDWYPQLQQEMAEAANAETNAQREQSEAALKKELGNAYDEYVQNGVKAAKEFGGDEFVQLLEDTGLGNHPTVVKALGEAGKALAEDKMAGSPFRGFSKSPEQAQREIGDLRLDAEFNKAYSDSNHPGHRDAVERMNQLYQDAYPEQEMGSTTAPEPTSVSA